MKLKIIFAILFITVSFFIVSATSSQEDSEEVVENPVPSHKIELPPNIEPLQHRSDRKYNIGDKWVPDDVEISRPIKNKLNLHDVVHIRKRRSAKALQMNVMMPSNIRKVESHDEEIQENEQTGDNKDEQSVGELYIIKPDDDTQPKATPQLRNITPNINLPKITH